MASPAWARERASFWWCALRGGGSRAVLLFGAISLVTGVTVAGALALWAGLPLLVAAVVFLAVVLATYMEGSYRMWRAAKQERTPISAPGVTIHHGTFVGNRTGVQIVH